MTDSFLLRFAIRNRYILFAIKRQRLDSPLAHGHAETFPEEITEVGGGAESGGGGSRRQQERQAEDELHACIVVKMESGKLLLVESKGDDRDNGDSAAKLRLGCLWAKHAGADYDYHMVFKDNRPTGEGWQGALNRVEFNELLDGE